MILKLQLLHANDILKLTPEGEIDFDRAKEIITELASPKKTPPDHSILLDARKTKAKLSTTNVWYLAAELHKNTEAFNRKSVLLVPSEDFDSAKFFQLCANNRGFQVGAFTDFEDAINWLATTVNFEQD